MSTRAPSQAAKSRSPRCGVLLVGNLPNGPLIGGVEVGVDMLLHSQLARRRGIRLFNTARRHDPSRSLRERFAYQSRRFAELLAQIVRHRPAVVHVKGTVGVNFWQSVGYCLIARALGRRVLLQLHGGDFDTWYASRSRIAQQSIRFALRAPAELLVLSEYWRVFVASLVSNRRLRVVPNGVRVDEALPHAGGPSPELVVATIGALGTRKGHFDIIDAAALLRDEPVRFVLVGEDELGGEGERLRAHARGLGVAAKIELPGAVIGRAKWELLARSDVFLLPSTGENMPNAILEAMAAGLPVVCTPVGAMPEMLGEGALYVPSRDSGAIASALRRLADAELRANMGQANRRRAEARFSFDAVAATLDAIYSQTGVAVYETVGTPAVHPADPARP